MSVYFWKELVHTHIWAILDQLKVFMKHPTSWPLRQKKTTTYWSIRLIFIQNLMTRLATATKFSVSRKGNSADIRQSYFARTNYFTGHFSPSLLRVVSEASHINCLGAWTNINNNNPRGTGDGKGFRGPLMAGTGVAHPWGLAGGLALVGQAGDPKGGWTRTNKVFEVAISYFRRN